MNWDPLNRLLVMIGRLVVGAVFVCAGSSKFVTQSNVPTMFTEFFPGGSIAGYVTAAMEVLLGLWLITGLLRAWSTGVAILLLVIFSGLIVREMSKPKPNPCGCIREVLPGDAGGGDILIDRNAEVRRQLRVSLGRNIALIGCAAMTLLVGGTENLTSNPTIGRIEGSKLNHPEPPAEAR